MEDNHQIIVKEKFCFRLHFQLVRMDLGKVIKNISVTSTVMSRLFLGEFGFRIRSRKRSE